MSVKHRGFGSPKMTPERRSEIARLGGKARALAGTGHHFSHDEAVAAGRKGGKSRAKKAEDAAKLEQLAESLKDRL